MIDKTNKPSSEMSTNVGASTSAGPKQIKRKRVNADDTNEDAQSQKRTKLELNVDLKRRTIIFISRSFLRIFNDSVKNMKLVSNINLGIQVLNILFTTHNCLRQNANQNGKMAEKVSGTGFVITSGASEYKMTYEAATKIVLEEATKQKFAYEKSSQQKRVEWYGTVGPYLDFLGTYQLRLRELRLGHLAYPVQKNKDEIREIPITEFGLEGSHQPLLEGITYPPEKRASQVQSLGPMTQLICYLKASTGYTDKFENACKKTFQQFPYINDVLSVLKNSTISASANAIRRMADLASIVSTRQNTRMSPPPNVFALYFAWDVTEGKIVEDFKDDNARMDGFSFSGIGAYKMYNWMCNHEWTMNCNMSQIHAQQVVFHSCFGTYKEDFGVLEDITTCKNFFQRSVFAQGFQKMNTTGTLTTINPIRFLKISKLASANQTGLLTGSFSQDHSVSCFSGKKEMKFTEAFLARVMSDGGAPTLQNRTPEGIAHLYHKITLGIIESERLGNSTLKTGTTEWYVNNITDNITQFSELQIAEEPKPNNTYFNGPQEGVTK
uniref:Nucleocapsid protein n=1 Tax=Dermapteran orthomyxo-related virus OKIAV170 TaxID=2746276 RepID=A0A7D7IQL2_9ORTO|nr:nucleocapsid protein [Dermapteran orthomyxo-related virus OKIAV170]